MYRTTKGNLTKGQRRQVLKWGFLFAFGPLVFMGISYTAINRIWGNVDCLKVQEIERIQVQGVVYKKGPVPRTHGMHGFWTGDKAKAIVCSGDLVELYEKISVGDSVVKKKGELRFLIFHNDSSMVHEFSYECGEDDFWLAF